MREIGGHLSFLSPSRKVPSNEPVDNGLPYLPPFVRFDDAQRLSPRQATTTQPANPNTRES